MNNKGVTLIELLIVIVVLGIIAGFSIVQVSEIITNSRINVDSFNLSTLNEVTEDYAQLYAASNSDVFDGIVTDGDRMQTLVTKGYLSSTIIVQQSGASFEWNVANQSWDLEGGETNGYYNGTTVNFTFDADTLDDITSSGTVSTNVDNWSTDDGYLENTTVYTRLFIPISSSTYAIEVSAALTAGSAGGYGIFFDTTLTNDNPSKDTGQIFQFDRGYDGGAMIVRPRTNGSEGGATWDLRNYNTALFPSKTADPTWWTAPHTIRIVVTNVDASTREAEFFLDGASLGTHTYANQIDGEQLYTGFRGWGSSSTKFYSLDVD